MDTIKKQLETLFAEQATASTTFLATLQPIAGAPDRIKLTPFGPSGCGCDQAMTVVVSHLESMTPEADRWHDCCGKRLRVMRVALKPEATVSAHDVVAATVRRTTGAHAIPVGYATQSECEQHERAPCSIQLGGWHRTN